MHFYWENLFKSYISKRCCITFLGRHLNHKRNLHSLIFFYERINWINKLSLKSKASSHCFTLKVGRTGTSGGINAHRILVHFGKGLRLYFLNLSGVKCGFIFTLSLSAEATQRDSDNLRCRVYLNFSLFVFVDCLLEGKCTFSSRTYKE